MPLKPNPPENLVANMSAPLALGVAGSCITGSKDQKHLALIYRCDDLRFCVLHLGWHERLYHEAWSGDYHWIEFQGIDTELQEAFIDWSVIVATASKDKPIPYSVVFDPGPNFDEQGNFLSRDGGAGLTCATFVLALFSDFSIPLVDFESWPKNRGGDFQWVRKILRLLRKYLPDAYWLEQVRRRNALSRFRPEEVLVTARHFRGAPLKFDDIKADAEHALSTIPA